MSKPIKNYYIYILSNDTGTLYVGMTNNLMRRLQEHRSNKFNGFTKRYHIYRLLYYEECNDILSTIDREKEIKRWNRRKKLKLVKTMNPEFKDLCDDWFDK